MKLRRILVAFGVLSIAYGLYTAKSTIDFVKRSQKIDAKVLGYSSVQLLERTEAPCSAFRKDCAVKLSYTINGTPIETEIPQPLFTRAKSEEVTLFVDPEDVLHPKMASLHVLFRNSTTSIFVGIMAMFLAWLLRNEAKRVK